MIKGTYDVAIDTLKYHRRGIVTLGSAEGAIEGSIDIHDVGTYAFSGACDDKDFTVDGEGDFGTLGHVEYRAKGNVWGNSLTATCESSAGKIEVFGTQVSASTGGAQSSHDYIMQASTGEFGRDDSTMYSGLYADGG